jgi:hypothetical protein
MARADSAVVAPRDDDSYRAICVPAVIGLLLGLLSWTAFLSYLFWFVPLAAIGISCYGLLQVRRYWPTLTGAMAARAGIVLALVCGLGAVVQAGIHRWAFQREARQAADLWVEFVRDGKLHEAFQLTLDPLSRLPLDRDLVSVYEDRPELKESFAKFAEAAAVQRLPKLGASAEVRFLGLDNLHEGQASARATVDYAVSAGTKPSDDDFIFQLVLYRLPDPHSGEWTWRVLLEPRIRSLSAGAEVTGGLKSPLPER